MKTVIVVTNFLELLKYRKALHSKQVNMHPVLITGADPEGWIG